MLYSVWHKQAVKKVTPESEFQRYSKIILLGIIIFAFCYFYTRFQNIPNALNKATADTSIILIGLSMLLSSICYFWNFLDSKIIYRKHLGIVGFLFGVGHLILSYGAFQRLLLVETWQQNAFWAPLTGLIALLIFTVMAIISNQYAATHLGGKFWRLVLRTGYIAMLFVLAHVVLLKLPRWITWYQGGMQTLPSMSLLSSAFIILVVVMRLVLWASLKRNSTKN